jgi:hypothetical protein
MGTVNHRLRHPAARLVRRKTLTGPTGDRTMSGEEGSRSRDMQAARAGRVTLNEGTGSPLGSTAPRSEDGTGPTGKHQHGRHE